MLDKNPETVKIIFKHFPLRMHKQAVPAALASMAAKKQGKFWEYHDMIFTEKRLTPQIFFSFAKKLNLDIEQFKKDMASPGIQKIVARDMKDGREAGVSGTPTIFIGGRRLKRRSLPDIQKLIDRALADQAKPASK